MDDEIKTGEMTGEIDESITVEEDFTLLEGKAVSISDDSDNKTNEEEVYEEALEIKESLDDIRQQIKDKLLDILEKGKITDVDGCEIELLNDQYTEKYNELKDVANSVLPGGKGASTNTNTSTTEIVKVNIDYDEILNAINERADWLYIDEDGQVMLNGEVVPKLKVVELEAEKIKADVGEFKTLTTENFTATNANITNLQADYGEFKTLTAQNFTATNGYISNLTSDVAHIGTLIGGNASIKDIQSLILTSKNTTIENALIKDAMIDTLSANKINTGTLNTNNVLIQSEDGSMLLQGNLQQFKDKNGKVRIQIGKDAKGDFTFVLYDENGTGQLINAKGIQSSNALADGIIVDAKIANNANISGGKIDMSSLFSTMNNSGYTLKSSKVKFDDKNQTLDVLFNSMNNTLENTVSTVSSHTTSISTQQGKIEQLIADTTIEDNGTTTTLKTAFNSVKDTVDSHTRTISSMGSTLNSVNIEYYVSTSSTALSGGSWSTNTPNWQEGKYIWQRINYGKVDGKTTYSTPVCIQGAKGEQGAKGDKGDKGDQGLQGLQGIQGERGEQGIQGDKGATGEKGQSLTKSTPQWYKSTSSTSQTGGSWVETMPSVEKGYWYWARFKLDWQNPTATTYTTPTLEQVYNKTVEVVQSLDGFKTTVSNTYATNDRVGGIENRVSTVEQTASSLTSKFTNGFNIGIIEQNVEGIKVKHTSIDSNSYTHMSPTGFYLKNKGKDILICDSNGLSYEGTITGSTIKGSIFKSGTDYNPNKQNITGLQIQDDTIYSYGTKNNGIYAVTKISGGTITIGEGADGAGLGWNSHVTSSDISMFKQGSSGYFYVGTTNAPGSGYSTTTTTIDTTTINIGSKDETTAFKVDYNDHCEFGNNYFTRGSLTINQLSKGVAKGTQTYFSGTTISATNIYQNGSSVSGSDIILKDNIKEYKDSALDIINQTKVYSFNRILANQDKTEIGFLAQQVPDIFVFDKGEFTAEELEGLTAEEKKELLAKKTKEYRTVLENKKLDEIANNVASFYDLNDEQTEEQISQIMDEYKNVEYEVPISTINQNNIIAIMFKAIQELSAKIDSLEKRLL